MLWKTTEIVALLDGPRFRIDTGSQGGDVDTTQILMRLKDAEGEYPETLFISGFTVEAGAWVTKPDEWDVDMVEVSDGMDSRGGLNSSDPDFCVMYAHAVSKLRLAGFDVVPCLKDYF